MDVLDAIKLRRSIRKFKDMRVEWDKVTLLVEAGKSAPTAGNLQNFRFVAVTDKSIIKAISEACLKQYWIQTAPLIIVIVGEPEKAERFYGVRGERLYSVQNCAAAAENILLTAVSIGLGACWVGAFEEQELKEAIGINDTMDARPQVVIAVGYPDEVVPEPMHYPIETLVHLERYGNRIVDMDAIMGNYSELTHRNAELIKGDVKNAAQKVKEKIKEHIDKLRKKKD